MSTHQLKDGRWMVRHAVGKDPTRPAANKRYFGRGLDAELAAKEFDAVLHAKVRKTAMTPSFAALADDYLEAKKMTMTPVGWGVTVGKMSRVILPRIGGLQVAELTPARLDQYANERVKDGVKRNTIHRELSDIRAILRWAVKRRLIASNPMDGFEFPRRDDARITPPSDAEFQAILRHAAPHLQRAMLIAYYTGLRPGREEMLCLRWEAVDFIGRTLMVLSAQKGGMPSRMVPLNQVILSALEKWYDEDVKAGIQYIIHLHGYKIDSLKTSWREAKKRARILRRIRLYDLRHACATNMLASGANLKAVSEILGHASPDMTMRVYQHVSDDLRRQAVDMLPGATCPNTTNSKQA